MDELDDSEELAELESLLYSQIHHSTDMEPNTKDMTSNTSTSQFFLPHRYFENDLSSNKNPEQYAAKTTAEANVHKDSQCHSNLSSTSSSTFPYQTIHICNPPPFQFPVTQIFQPPVNNIVFMTPNTQINSDQALTKNQRRKIRKQIMKEQQQVFQTASNNAEVFRCLGKEDRLKVIKMQKKERYLLKRKERKKFLKEQKLIEKYNNQENLIDQEGYEKKHIITENLEVTEKKLIPNQVIELSDTDDEAVVAIEQKIETVELSSDEDKDKESSEDEDILLVNNELSIKELESGQKVEKQTQNKSDAELMKPPSDAETTSLSSGASLLSADKLPLTPKSQKLALNNSRDLMNTPESSNDFLDNSLDVSGKGNFNFAFHDQELAGQKQFLKPRSLAEIYETESSCSASDASSLKNPVFNELEFDSPSKQLFSDANLESFGDFITPKRKSGGIPSILTTTNVEEESMLEQSSSKTKTSQHLEKSNSDSSSESEYGDELKSSRTKVPKKLPNLSHFEVDDVQAKSTPQPKSSKKKNLAKNKFDFIKDASKEETEIIQSNDTNKEIENKSGDSKKSKKRKQNVSETNQDGHDNNNPVDQNITGSSKETITTRKRKKQNSKSDTELEKPSKGKESKKKLNTKSDSELEDTEFVNKSKKKTKQKSKVEVEQATEAETQLELNQELDNSNEVNNSSNTEVTKRKKRKSTVEVSCDVENLDKKRKETDMLDKSKVLSSTLDNTDKSDLNYTTQSTEENDEFDSSDDVEIIEDSLPICIDLNDYASSDNESHFNSTELENLPTKLELSNVTNDDSLNNSWDIEPEQNTSISYDAVATVSTTEDNIQVETINDEQSWCTPGFDATKALKSMQSDATKWKIMERDRIHIKLSNNTPRCKKCREIGHLAHQCNRELRCWLCGETGHQEPRCPNTVCTRCGRKTQFFTTRCGRCVDLIHYTCKTCGSKGHSEDLCPDFWRRYHLTTEVGPMKQVPVNLKPGPERWCSGCAKQGHFEHNCNYYNRTHIPTKPHILRYNDVYKMSKTSKKSEQLSAPNKDPYEETATSIQHKSMQVKLKLCKEVNDNLQCTKGIDLLKELTTNLCFSYSFENEGDTYFLKIDAHPTDIIAIKRLLNVYINNPTMNYHKIVISNSELLTFDSDEGKGLIESLSTLNVSHRMETKIPIKAIYLYGDPLDIILAQHKLEMFMSKALENNVSIKTLDSRKGQKRIQAIIKVRPYILDEIKSHPAMDSFMERESIKWSINNAHLVLEGPSQNVRKVANDLVSIKKGVKCPTRNFLTRIEKIFEYLNTPNMNAEYLNKLLYDRNYEALNCSLLIIENWDDKLKALNSLRTLFQTRLYCAKDRAKQFKGLLHTLERPRKHKFYTNAINKLGNGTSPDINLTFTTKESEQTEEDNITRLYSFGVPCEDLSNVFHVNISPHHAGHLLRTEEGNDFLADLNTQISLEVKMDPPSISFYCNENQKEKVMKDINFYFQILEFEFPTVPSVMYRNLTTRLSRVALEYYLTNCKELYNEIYKCGNPALYAKLHGLLFVKYEFLGSYKHVETLKYYLGVLSKMNDKERLNYTEFRRVKTAAMFLFCPFPLDIDYQQILLLAIPPTVPKFITYVNYTESVNILKSRMKYAKQIWTTNKDIVKSFEIKTIQTYVYKKNFTGDAIHLASAFLTENGIPFV